MFTAFHLSFPYSVPPATYIHKHFGGRPPVQCLICDEPKRSSMELTQGIHMLGPSLGVDSSREESRPA